MQTVLTEQSADKIFNIYITGFNKVDQAKYARLTTTLGKLEKVARKKITLTLSIDKNGQTESLEDCLNNKNGVKLVTLCAPN